MVAEAVLPAETDPRTLISLLDALPESLSRVRGYTCPSADSLIHRLRQSSIRLLLNMDDEQSLCDVAASVETFTRQRARERLLTLCKVGSIQ